MVWEIQEEYLRNSSRRPFDLPFLKGIIWKTLKGTCGQVHGYLRNRSPRPTPEKSWLQKTTYHEFMSVTHTHKECHPTRQISDTLSWATIQAKQILTSINCDNKYMFYKSKRLQYFFTETNTEFTKFQSIELLLIHRT